MSALSIQPTYPIFTDIDGQPLEDGYVWIGTANLDPQTNPINVYWDAALTLPAAQPIRTLAGYPANSGTPARLYVNSDYSIRVMNKNGSAVYSAPAATERYSGVVVNGINAEDVVYDPPFSGGVQTDVEAKLAQTVSVKDFGALGDGITNDTTAIQAAIDSGAGTVLFPAGNYVISGVSITSSIALVGDVVSGSEYLTRLLCSTNGVLVERAAGADNIVNVQLENLRVEKTGTAKAAGTYGIKFVAANAGISVRNVEIRFFEKNLWLRGVIGAQFSNIASRGGAYGLFTESHNIAPFNYDTTNCDYYGCKFTDSNDVGVYLGATTQGQNFFGGDIERNLVGVEFANTAPASSVINFFGTWFEENTTVHWKFTQKPIPVVFQGCYIYGSTLFDNAGSGVITATVRECRLLAGVAVDKDIFRGSWVDNSVEGTVTFNATDPDGYYCKELTNVNISVGGISIYSVENLGSGRYFVAANAAPVTTGLNQGSEWLNITTGKRYLYVNSQWNEVMSAIVHTRTLDPTSIPSGSTGTTGPFTVTGAALGDMVLVGAPYDLQGIIATAYVNAANAVTIRMYNPTGGAIDLTTGTWQVRVVKQ